MRSQTRRPFLLWSLPLVLLTIVHGQDKRVEETAPVPTAGVQQLLDEAALASKEGDATKALRLADRALTVAQQTTDTAGEAQARRVRALHLMTLDRNGEAQTAWRDAEAAWKQTGDGPGQIEALGWQAVLEFRANPQLGSELLRRAIVLAETDTKRPRAAATSLVGVRRTLVDRSLLSEARQAYEIAVAVAERVAPDSLEHASGLNGLGIVAEDQGDLTAARDYHQRALVSCLKESLYYSGHFGTLPHAHRTPEETFGPDG